MSDKEKAVKRNVTEKEVSKDKITEVSEEVDKSKVRRFYWQALFSIGMNGHTHTHVMIM